MMINDTAAEKKRRLVCGAQLSSQKSSPLPTAPASHSSGACRSLSKGARTCRAAHAPRGKAVRLHAPGPSQGAPLYPWAFYRSVWRRPRPCAPGRAECRGFALSGAPPTPWRTRGTARATAAAAACRVGRCAQGAHLAALPHPRCARAVLCLLSPLPPPACPPNCAAGRWSAPLAFLTRLTKASHAYQLYTFALQVHRPRARRPARPSRGSGADACGEGGTLGRSEAVATTGAARGGRRGGWGGAIEVCQWTDHCKSGGKDAARHTERR